ncbi:TPA: hypothetical protein L1V50_005183 [Escherichia coli]|nr:hypothetical protein [Escherichia coli]EEY1477908.1 hypothetical protein [Escherichia coli]EFF4363016.1 hypothetical protein [Escherichia coli]EFF6708008.1 hypothetical protein [Escherichia coli]EFG5821213.1 hypothetical protein [Escherichia coli]
MFSVATGRLDKLLSVVSIILGSSVIGGFIPEISGVFIVVIATVQTIYGFGQKSGNAMRKSAEYLQLFDDAEKYSDSELKIQLKTLEKTDDHIWSSLKDIAILKTQIKIGVSIEQQEKLPTKSKLMRFLCG